MIVITLIVILAVTGFYFKDTLVKLMSQMKSEHLDNMDKTSSTFFSQFRPDAKTDDNRRGFYEDVVTRYYNIVTNLYEYGWGESFHFSPKYPSEAFSASTKRYEHLIAHKLEVDTGAKILDVGCGVGGPLREIWRALPNVSITGVNITEEHIKRAQMYNEREGVTGCELVVGDFHDLKFPDNHFDACYDFEAILHSVDRAKVFKQVHRVVKPGARFVTAQYCLLENYDDNNAEHKKIIVDVDNLNGCFVEGWTIEKTKAAIESAGWIIEDQFDAFDKFGTVGFHECFSSKAGGVFFGTEIGMSITTNLIKVLEAVKIAPAGTSAVQTMLCDAGKAFVQAGERKILTPGYVFVLRKANE